MGTYHDDPLISYALDVEPDIVQRERHALDDIIRVLIEVFEELFDVLVPALEQVAVVDVHHHRFKILILLLLWQNLCLKILQSISRRPYSLGESPKMMTEDRIRQVNVLAWLLTHSR